MPSLDGFQVLRAMQGQRATASIPAIAMTGLPDPQRMLQSAADALRARVFLYKPFGMDDLTSAVADLLAGKSIAPSGIGETWVARGRVSINIVQRQLFVDEREVRLSSFNRLLLIAALLSSEGGVSREALLSEVWPDSDSLNTVDVTIHRLRRELAERELPIGIEGTGQGYRLVDRRPG